MGSTGSQLAVVDLPDPIVPYPPLVLPLLILLVPPVAVVAAVATAAVGVAPALPAAVAAFEAGDAPVVIVDFNAVAAIPINHPVLLVVTFGLGFELFLQRCLNL